MESKPVMALRSRFASLGPEFNSHGHGTTSTLGFGIGVYFGLGLGLFFLSENFVDFGAYLVFFTFFHWSEYILVALYRIDQLSANAYLINHSDEYTYAFIACMVEYFLEWYFIGWLKNNWWIYYIGIIVTLGGTIFRVLAQVHGRQNFTHEVQVVKREEHVLVTNGVFKFVRHPGYFGWFWYTVGTQIILANPICLIGFAYVSYKFFDDRIRDEERHLVKFFGNDYEEFRKKTPTYIPLIK